MSYRILITNDDGMAAPGLRALVEVAKQLGEVIVVAPDSPQSGQGHAITISEPLRLYPVDVFEGVEAYECSGTPVDCVKLAKHVVLINRKVDLCVSGINHGSNASINIIYSGTLSAAMEASLEGITSIGFPCSITVGMPTSGLHSITSGRSWSMCCRTGFRNASSSM